jgi:hypothetical protein
MPRLGDDDWGAGFASVSNRPIDRPNTMWRIRNACDIVGRIPPGYKNSDSGRFISQDNMLNYAFVGEEIHFFADGRLPESTRNIFSRGTETVIVDTNQSFIASLFNTSGRAISVKNKKPSDVFGSTPYKHPKESPIPLLERLVPRVIWDHIPANYFVAMQKARAYFEDKEENVRVGM